MQDVFKCGVINYNKGMSLYVHIPFCVSKCTYCSFCSFANKSEFMQQYVTKLIDEIETKSKEFAGYEISSVYIGGGTPSILPLGSITQIIQAINKCFKLKSDINITVEGNPNSLSLEKLKEFKDAGVNRLSIGLQSSNDNLLKLLNRPHTAQDFVNCMENAHKVGFSNINVDIILGIPTQTLDDVKNTLNFILSKNITHISAYGLILEKGTKLYKQVKSQELKPLSDDLCNEMYDYVVRTLKENGFNRYEISNFAKQGFESVHNLNYWRRGQYLGVGVAAFSFVHGVHWENTSSLKDYLTNCNKKLNIEIETSYTAKLETIMLALRLDEGLDIEKFNKTFQTDFLKEYDFVLQNLLNNKLVRVENGRVIINDQHISNAIIAEFA